MKPRRHRISPRRSDFRGSGGDDRVPALPHSHLMLVRLEDVHKSYAGRRVLQGTSLQINPQDRVGLIGRNGCGKTTAFRLIKGQEEPDSGHLFSQKNIRIGLLDQMPVYSGGSTVLEEGLSVFSELTDLEAEIGRLEHRMSEVVGERLEQVMQRYTDLRHRYEMEGGFVYRARCESVLGGLGFESGNLSRAAEHLSGGEKSRLGLAKLLLAEPDLLLLDEPTNHLDIRAIEWLEGFLAQYRRAFVIISHDRFLLDRTVTRIVEIEEGRAVTYTGNYTAYVRQREERRLARSREYERQQELISRTEEFIRRNIAGQKTKQAKARRNMLERLGRVDAIRDQRVGAFKLGEPSRTGDTVLVTRDLGVGYGGEAVISGITLSVRRGDRIGIVGPNGSGKSTFVRTISGEIRAVQGSFRWGSNVTIAYFDQELSSLDASATLLEELRAVAPEAADGDLRGHLARFLFTGDEVLKQVDHLSGGERSRLALAKLTLSPSNVLVLDEPTNHLDIPSREALEGALADYAGTMLVVSHDRYLLDRLVGSILSLEGGAVSHFAGSYSEFHESRLEAEAAGAVEATPLVRDRQARARKTNRSRSRGPEIEQLEAAIAALERECAELGERLANPSQEWDRSHYVEMASRYDSLTRELAQLYSQWEDALDAG